MYLLDSHKSVQQHKTSTVPDLLPSRLFEFDPSLPGRLELIHLVLHELIVREPMTWRTSNALESQLLHDCPCSSCTRTRPTRSGTSRRCTQTPCRAARTARCRPLASEHPDSRLFLDCRGVGDELAVVDRELVTRHRVRDDVGQNRVEHHRLTSTDRQAFGELVYGAGEDANLLEERGFRQIVVGAEGDLELADERLRAEVPDVRHERVEEGEGKVGGRDKVDLAKQGARGGVQAGGRRVGRVERVSVAIVEGDDGPVSSMNKKDCQLRD